MRAFLLRRKMLLFIKNINHYMTNEVIEQHWHSFMNVIKQVFLNPFHSVGTFIKHYAFSIEPKRRRCNEPSWKILEELHGRLYAHFIKTNQAVDVAAENVQRFL